MPAFGAAYSDTEIAAVANYVTARFGAAPSHLTARDIADFDARHPGRPQESHTMQWPEGAIFTLGHSTLPIERFIAVLQTYGIERLVDIRTIPGSRHNPQFNETALANTLRAEHLEYLHMQTLGGLRRARKDSPNTGWRNQNFRGYADYMQTEAFQDALESLIGMSRQKARSHHVRRSSAMEMPPLAGGRRAQRAWMPTIEILSETSHRMHKLTPFAQVHGLQITYPPAQATLL